MPTQGNTEGLKIFLANRTQDLYKCWIKSDWNLDQGKNTYSWEQEEIGSDKFSIEQLV